MRFLYEGHIPVVPLMLPSFIQPQQRHPPIIFDLFAEDDNARPIGAKRESEEEVFGDLYVEFR